MKYFIDFEATQFSGEIISIGCVDENGRQFYTLVKPAKMSEMTDFIEELTGIHRLHRGTYGYPPEAARRSAAAR